MPTRSFPVGASSDRTDGVMSLAMARDVNTNRTAAAMPGVVTVGWASRSVGPQGRRASRSVEVVQRQPGPRPLEADERAAHRQRGERRAQPRTTEAHVRHHHVGQLVLIDAVAVRPDVADRTCDQGRHTDEALAVDGQRVAHLIAAEADDPAALLTTIRTVG